MRGSATMVQPCVDRQPCLALPQEIEQRRSVSGKRRNGKVIPDYSRTGPKVPSAWITPKQWEQRKEADKARAEEDKARAEAARHVPSQDKQSTVQAATAASERRRSPARLYQTAPSASSPASNQVPQGSPQTSIVGSLMRFFITGIAPPRNLTRFVVPITGRTHNVPIDRAATQERIDASYSHHTKLYKNALLSASNPRSRQVRMYCNAWMRGRH